MDETTAANIIRWYESLEERLVDVMKVLPPHPHNFNAWSPTLATVLVESCNLIESVLYHITPEPAPLPKPKKPKPRHKLTRDDYELLYGERLRWRDRKVVFFQDPWQWRAPFAKDAKWWNIHNRSKHRRLDHVHNFTLGNALDALAGALVVIATVPAVPAAIELASAMIAYEWIEPILPEDMDVIKDIYKGKYAYLGWLCPETALFAIPLSTYHTHQLPSTPQGLLPSMPEIARMGGQKLRKLIRN